MKNSEILASLHNDQELFDAVDAGLIVLDPDKKIIFFNYFADQFLELSKPDYQNNLCCFTIFSEHHGPCSDCPLTELDKGRMVTKSYTLLGSDGQKRLAKVTYKKIEEYVLCTVYDVTKEVTLIKKIDLSKKATLAKNIILERRYEKQKDELAISQQIINNLPEALIYVDENFEIQQYNNTTGQLFIQTEVNKCYQLLGREKPCELCPAEKGFDFAHEFKKRHSVGDRYYTELILRGSEGKNGLLLFSDTTRQINLINQIKSHQDVLTGVVELVKIMQNEPNVSLVLEDFMHRLLTALSATKVLLFVNDVRPGSLWLALSKNMTDVDLGEITRSYLSREVQSSRVAVVSPELFSWEKTTIMPLVGVHDTKVGMLALDINVELDDLEKLELFVDTVGAYLHNQLLMKQLDVSANTDPLTGIYNRRYFEKSFEEEAIRFKQYHIHFAVVTLDVNLLKKANDNHGHEVGDRLLKRVASLLLGTVRPSDIVARVGGDEFVILLSNADQKSAEDLCRRLTGEVFKNIYIDTNGAGGFPVTASVGYAGSDLCEVKDLISRADERMYEDKEQFYAEQKTYR